MAARHSTAVPLLSLLLLVGMASHALAARFTLVEHEGTLIGTSTSGVANTRQFPPLGNWRLTGGKFDDNLSSTDGNASGASPVFHVGKQLRFDGEGALLFSNGGAAAPAMPGLSLSNR